MNSFKRIFFTLKAQLDDVADEFENHEAVAGIAIKELESYQGKTRIHQHRLQEMIRQFEIKLADLNKEAEIWSIRALKLKDQDEPKALECVKRMLDAQKQIKAIEPELTKTQEQFVQCQKDLADIQTRLQGLHTQKEVLSARQNRIQLQSSMRPDYADPAGGAQAVFKRWEQSVVGAELTGPAPTVKDSFAEAFVQEESTLELKQLLDELAVKQPKDSAP